MPESSKGIGLHSHKRAEAVLAVGAGGSALAKKLVEIYFSLFRLILEGRLGHGGQLASAAQAKAQAARRGPPRKGPPLANGTKPPPPPAKAGRQRLPSSEVQVGIIAFDSHFTCLMRRCHLAPWVLVCGSQYLSCQV